jgi:hypothetical protein
VVCPTKFEGTDALEVFTLEEDLRTRSRIKADNWSAPECSAQRHAEYERPLRPMQRLRQSCLWSARPGEESTSTGKRSSGSIMMHGERKAPREED